jgi:uncharacterized membrane protein
MTRYELFVFLHVTSVIVWVGAATTMDLLFFRAERLRDPLELKKTGELQEWLIPRVFIPTALSTLLFGVLLVWDGPWEFGDLFVWLGLVGFAIGFFTGLLYLKPQAEKMGEIAAKYGPTSVEAQRHGHRLLVIARVQLLVLFLVVADMAIKPTTDDVGTLVAGAAILVAAIVAGALVLRKRVPEPAPPVTEPQ